MDHPVLVQGSGVVKRFGDFTAVDEIDFTVHKGECFGFLGPNGAGKTSTARMTQCVSPVTEGVITVDGLTVGDDDREIKSRIGVAPQEDNLDEDLTVIDNLILYAGYFGIAPDIALERSMKLLEFFHLEDRLKARLRSLSGGMRRRLIIARALINEPRLLILDEPTTGLDPQARHLIWQRVRNLKSQGVTIILTTHYMEEATQLCDRIAIMDNGKILLLGPPGKLIEENITGDVIELRPKSQAAIECIAAAKKEGARVEKAGDTYLIYTSEPDDVMQSLAGCEHHFLLHRKATLEDLFLQATGRALREGA